ncbi:hypothetical protein P873_13715 [Arenimonas composti TR7-09 = DSM 18010]|uniref:Lipoprotein n=1 Tax=Arenimonas composti TR7-09 = DSM 18010 TaxID=1121013 RepID=A0A091BD00_9GAMM|nr:hypothetical protein P873_13715 [Arenimonas composti TR7-09 = DSM 18010]
MLATVLASALVLAGCGETVADQVAELRPQVQQVFERIAALEPAVRAAAPVRSDGFGTTHARTVQSCAEYLPADAGTLHRGAPLIMGECARAEYVFVLRVHRELAPSVGADRDFSPGAFDGDVLLFRLADAALLGGFRVTAASSDRVQIPTDAGGNAVGADDRLRNDLSANVFVAIDDRLRELIPGVHPETR